MMLRGALAKIARKHGLDQRFTAQSQRAEFFFDLPRNKGPLGFRIGL